jgi:hypothetical protein
MHEYWSMSMTDESVLETAQRVGIRLVVTTPHSRNRLSKYWTRYELK